jgi:hypothetical protein
MEASRESLVQPGLKIAGWEGTIVMIILETASRRRRKEQEREA